MLQEVVRKLHDVQKGINAPGRWKRRQLEWAKKKILPTLQRWDTRTGAGV